MDRWTLIRMVGVLAVGLPIFVVLSRVIGPGLGLHGYALIVPIVVAGVVILFLSRRARRALSAKVQFDIQRVAADARYRLLAENAVDVVHHLRGTEVVWISPSAVPAFGWSVEEWIGADFRPHIHADDLDAVIAALRRIAQGSSAIARYRIATADGGYRWVEGHGKPYIDAEGNIDGVIVAVRIVDEQVRAEQQIETERQRFVAVVENAPSAISVRDVQGRYTLVNKAFCQLFGGKSVEDVVGQAEDQILPSDVLERSRQGVGRILAEEEVIEEESIQQGSANTLVTTQRFPLRDSAGKMTEFVTIRTDITHRKKMEREAAECAMWDERIRTAIASGWLLTYSQPIVDIATRETVGEELLVRLREVETATILSPNEFIPQCEQHGLMPLIDRYMAGQAIELAKTGRPVSVNITGQTISDPTAMNCIFQALTIAGPSVAGKIIIEITESTALASPEAANTFSLNMRSLGCRVALDDFGTGYGTFTDLGRLDLYELKIDQSFVQNMVENRNDERVVKSIVSVARTFGLTTVGEGVESEATLEKLAELGADHAQGYLFGKPKPIGL